MPTYDVGGVPIEFPYEAYPCQLDYMHAVVRALDAGNHALLESPTGTGKTLCLLCAALGWRRHRDKVVTDARTSWEAQADPNAPRSAVPRIWYSSRTHTQLRQVMSELKRTSYKPLSVVLGSRQHFCIHSSVSRHTGARQNAMCRRAVDDHKCHFHVGFRKCGNKVSTALKDMEEIVESCKEANVCPYYKVREDAKEAELLLLPYDYLIGTQTRDSIQVPLRNSILIFDEGHNIEKSCEESASFELTQADVAGAMTEIDDAFDLIEQGAVNCDEALGDMPTDMALASMNLVKRHLMGLEDAISSEKLQKDPMTDRRMFKARGSHVLELLRRGSDLAEGANKGRGLGTTKEEMKLIATTIKKATSALTYGQETANSGGLYLDKIQNLLSTAFKREGAELDNNYQVLIYEEKDSDAAKRGVKRKAVDFFSTDNTPARDGAPPRTLCLWCFSCSVAMQELMKHEVHSVIVTSGTLSPMASTAEAFGVPFPVMLENSHVIDARKQLFGGVLTCGPDKVPLDASFGNRNELAYIKDLGNTVRQLASNVPDGVLLAFSSYSVKESVMQAWRQSGVLEEINALKPLFEEPKGNMETKLMMEKYNAALAKGPVPGGTIGGAILAAVCRGKLCEGIDFTDRQCRMVVMVGIPYPSKNDLRVMLKQDFLDARGTPGDGRRWYQREAIRAVNQTLGRVIRHRADYGAVMLCDSRYASGHRLSGIASGLSSWLRPQVSVINTFQSALDGVRRFFGASITVPSAPATHTAPAQQMAPTGAAAQPPFGGSGAQRGGASAPMPSATAVASGPAGATPSAGTSLGKLGALWRGLKRNAVVHVDAAAEKGRAEATAGAGAGGSSSSSASPGKAQVARGPATPQESSQQASRDRSAKQEAVKPQRPQKPLKVTAFRRAAEGPAARVPQDAPTERWLKSAEALLPVMEMDLVRANLAAARAEADEIAAGSGGSDSKLTASLRNIAECLIPEMCFDTPAEERTREELVRNAVQLLPKLLRPLWKSTVQEILELRGSSKKMF